jgi:hypothetical protein
MNTFSLWLVSTIAVTVVAGYLVIRRSQKANG